MIGPQFLEYLFSISLQATVVVLATHWLGKLTGSEQTRCRLWTCCFIGLLLLAFAGVTLPHLRIAPPSSVLDTETGAAMLAWQHHIGVASLVLWMGGVAVLLITMVARWWRMHRYLHRCARLEPMNRRSRTLRPTLPEEQLNKATVLASSTLAAPFCWQFHRPYIVLPNFVLDFDETRQRFIICHELEHLRLGHPMQLFLQRLVEVVFWFHPLAWWASRQAALAREFACDDAAISDKSETAEYLRTLMEILQRVQPSDGVSQTALTFGGRISIVTRRARRLVHMAHTEPPRQERRLSTSASIACVLLVTIASTFVWLPINLQASPFRAWSPWPNWSARVLHDFGIEARDFEGFENRFLDVDEEDEPQASPQG